MDVNRQNLLNALKNLYQINEEDIKDITGNTAVFKFNEVRQSLKKLKVLIPERYLDEIVSILLDNEINTLNSYITQLNQLINQIKNLNLNNHNIQQQVYGINEQFRKQIDTLIVLLGKYKGIFSDRLIEKELGKIKKYEQEIEKRKSQFDKLTEEIQRLSAEVSVEKFADIFQKEASKYKKLAIGFGIISVILLFINIYIGKIFYDELMIFIEKNGDIPTSQLIAGNLLRIFVLSIGIYALLYFVRLVNINMHLYVLNIHRHNALRTFRTFVDSVDDKSVKEQLTSIIAKYIFDTHSTGYIKSDSSKASDSNIVFSLIEKGTDRLSKEK